MTSSEEAGLKGRVVSELRAYLLTSAYLLVWLAALMFYRNTLEGEAGVQAAPLGAAVGKALILGKFVLLGETMRAGYRITAPTLVHRIAWRSLSLLLLLVVLTVVEEVVVGWVHGSSATEALAELTSHPLEHAASCLLMLLVLVPFVAVKQLSVALGPGQLQRLVLGAATGDVPSEGRDI
jgi:hypothetical protein